MILLLESGLAVLPSGSLRLHLGAANLCNLLVQVTYHQNHKTILYQSLGAHLKLEGHALQTLLLFIMSILLVKMRAGLLTQPRLQ